MRFPEHGGRGSPAHYILPVIVDGDDRDAVRARMAENGVQTSLHYPPVHLFAHYRGRPGDLPRTEYVADHMITLPLYPTMTPDQVDRVVDALEDALARH